MISIFRDDKVRDVLKDHFYSDETFNGMPRNQNVTVTSRVENYDVHTDYDTWSYTHRLIAENTVIIVKDNAIIAHYCVTSEKLRVEDAAELNRFMVLLCS